MYTSLDWINELVNLETVQLNELIDKLTLGGFEVEETLDKEINKQKKIILDISATANRADSLSIKGLAKEVTALLNKQSLKSSYIQSDLKYQEEIKSTLIESKTSENYSTFVAITIEYCFEDLKLFKLFGQANKCSECNRVHRLPAYFTCTRSKRTLVQSQWSII